MRLAFDAITSFSASPLRWTVGLGGVACLLGVLWFVQILWSKWVNPSGPERGWPSLIAAIVFMGGIQLISIGMLGQYVSRIFEESKRRPLYFVRDRMGGGEKSR